MSLDAQQLKNLKKPEQEASPPKKENVNLENEVALIRKEVEQNRELLISIHEKTEQARHYIKIGRIISFIYLTIIVVPIVLAFIYLPPFLRDAVKGYKELIVPTESIDNLDKIDIHNLLKGLQ